nr:putative ribonuclease H-like domain-containing protein [Tanacetum cinerariifolium]
EQGLIIAALKDELKKLKGKAIVDNTLTTYTIDPEMLKVDVEPIAPRLLNNRTVHSDYLRLTKEQAVILRKVVEQGKFQNPLNNSLDHALGNACPLTRIITTTKVPSRKPIALETYTPKPVVTLVFSRKPRKSKTTDPVHKSKVVQIILCYLDFGCSKHMPGDRSQLTNFVNKFLGTIKFKNDHVAKITGYSDYQNGNIMILRVYYMEELGHNLYSIRKLCDSNLEVPFRQHTCYIHNLEGVDLLIESRGNNLYTLSLRDMMAFSPICLLSKASKTKPTGWTFTIVGNACPLTRIITTTKVPSRKPIALETYTPKTVVTLVFSRKPRKSKTTDPVRKSKVVQIVLCYLDFGCSKHMPGDRSQLTNFVNKFLGTIKFKNDHVEKIMGYSDYQNGNIMILRVYYMEELGHNLYSIRQLCDSNLEVPFRQHTCYIHNLEGVDLLIESRGNNLYTLSLRDMMASKDEAPDFIIKFLKMIQVQLKTHVRRIRIDKGTEFVNQTLRECYEKVGISHETSVACSLQQNGVVKRRNRTLIEAACTISKDEAPNFIIKFLKMIQVRLKTHVRRIRIDKGTEFVNQTLRECYEKVGISHETSVACSLQQNGVVKRRNRTLIEAACTMLIYAKALLFLWAEAVATICYTQNGSIIRLYYVKTPYELLHDKLPDLSFFYVFDFDELAAMAFEHSSSELALYEMTPATISSGLVSNLPSSTLFILPLRTDWGLLFQPLFDELLTPPPSIGYPTPEVIALITKV